MTLTATVKQLKILAAWILLVMFVLFLVAALLGLYMGTKEQLWITCYNRHKEPDRLLRATYCNAATEIHFNEVRK